MSSLDTAALAEGLDRAVDELLAVRAALSSHPVALPDMALDEALRQHSDYQQGRREFAAAVEALLDSPWDALPEAVLNVESAAHTMVGRAAEAAWQLGLRARIERG